MITDKDVQKLLTAFLKIFATKEDLKDFATKEDLKELWQRIDDQLVDFRNDNMDHLDANYKELLAMREEQTMHAHTHMRQDKRHENHEKRIMKLESVSVTP